jgi:lysyl-tRNA synthetase class 2
MDVSAEAKAKEEGVLRPMIMYDYPAQMAALARRKPTDPRYAERFEVYVAGIELANAFSELTDPREQLSRFRAEQKLRKKLGRIVYPIDMDFIRALRHMPPAGGVALGVDRLVMLLTDAKRIEEVMLFPARELFDENPSQK